MVKRIELPKIPEQEQTPLVKALLRVIAQLAEQVQRLEEGNGRLKDEIAVLKGEKKRPTFKPSKMEEQAGQERDEQRGQRPGSEKRSKTQELEIHEERLIAPQEIPEGSRFKGGIRTMWCRTSSLGGIIAGIAWSVGRPRREGF